MCIVNSSINEINFNRKYLKRKKVYRFDCIILFLALALAILPISRLPLGTSNGINVEAPLQILIAIMLLIRVAKYGATQNSLPIVFFGFMSFVYLSISIFQNAELHKPIRHLFSFFPFFIACLYIWVGTSISPNQVLDSVLLVGSLSAMIALWLNYFKPDLLLGAYLGSYNEYSVQIFLNWGRAIWMNATITFFSFLGFIYVNRRNRVRKLIYSLAIIVTFIGLFATFGRTVIFGFLLFIILLGIKGVLNTKKYNKKMLNRWRIFFAFAGIVLSLNVLPLIDSRMSDLLEYRIYNLLKFKSSYFSDFEMRKLLYTQYLERLEEHFLLGQGLGVPLSTFPVQSCWSDVTLISFCLPFGIFGICSFVLFVSTLWKSLDKVKIPEFQPLAKALQILMFIALLISFNDDIWSHNFFVIYLSCWC